MLHSYPTFTVSHKYYASAMLLGQLNTKTDGICKMCYTALNNMLDHQWLWLHAKAQLLVLIGVSTVIPVSGGPLQGHLPAQPSL